MCVQGDADDAVRESETVGDDSQSLALTGHGGDADDGENEVINLSDSEVCKDEIMEREAEEIVGVADIAGSCSVVPACETEDAGAMDWQDSQALPALEDGPVETSDASAMMVEVEESPLAERKPSKPKTHRFGEDAERMKILSSNLEVLKKKLEMKRTEFFNNHVHAALLYTYIQAGQKFYTSIIIDISIMCTSIISNRPPRPALHILIFPL